MTYKIAWVQPNFQQGPKEFNAYYLPYSCGILWSYAYQFPEISNNYELGDFIWRRDNIDQTVELLKEKLFSNNPGDAHATVWALIVFQNWWKNYFL